MSNGYNDFKIEMENYIHHFTKDGKKYEGIKYTNGNDLDAISYAFCNLMFEDPYEFQQIQIPEKNGVIPVALTVNDELKMVPEIEENSKVLIVTVGKAVYEKTLYVFHNDWLMYCSDDDELFVVDENHIQLWKEILKK